MAPRAVARRLRLAEDRALRQLRPLHAWTAPTLAATVAWCALLVCASGGAADSSDRISSQAHVDPGYPTYAPLGEILDFWNPDVSEPPAGHERYDTLKRLDFQKPADLELAKLLRAAELPFIVYNIPELEATRAKWTEEYLVAAFGDKNLTVDTSVSNHFMFYPKQMMPRPGMQGRDSTRGKANPYSTPPTGTELKTYKEFAAEIARPAAPDERHVYLQANSRALPFFEQDYGLFNANRDTEHLFVIDPSKQKGVHCRFGMKGNIAESHYDTGRNYVSMARGHKRYILQPPLECPNLKLMMRGPMARHSAVDWSDRHTPNAFFDALAPLNVADEKFDAAKTVDTIIGAGDALYIPSFWFHYPISLDTNIQCNSRSGTPDADFDHIEVCGFHAPLTEQSMSEVEAARAQLASRFGVSAQPVAMLPGHADSSFAAAEAAASAAASASSSSSAPEAASASASASSSASASASASDSPGSASAPAPASAGEGRVIADLDPNTVPISVAVTGASPPSAVVTLCALDFASHAANPTEAPMFRDLVRASGCQAGSSKVREVSIADLKATVAADREASVAQPTGFVFHQARVGSTLVANMFAANADTFSYAESRPMADLLMSACPILDTATCHDYLRTTAAAMGRPHRRKHLVFKMQSITVARMDTLLAAFPAARWVFLYRDPVEIAASMFHRVSKAATVADTPIKSVLSKLSMPCVSSARGSTSPTHQALIASLLSQRGHVDKGAATTGQWCAAHVASLGELALMAAAADPSRALFVGYETLPDAFFTRVLGHFDMLPLADTLRAHTEAVAHKYSKDRGRDVEWAGDASDKQAATPPNLRAFSDAIARPTFNRLSQAAAGTVPTLLGSGSAAAAAAASAAASSGAAAASSASSPAAGSVALPSRGGGGDDDDDVGYPQLHPLGEVLRNWNPDNPDPPASYAKHDTLRRLDYQKPDELQEARYLREAELPFIVYNIPGLNSVVGKWTDDYLTDKFGSTRHTVEQSVDNHFMYYHAGKAGRDRNWEPPTKQMFMTFPEWLQKANAVTDVNSSHYYFRASAHPVGSHNDWIREDYEIFKNKKSLFIIDPAQQRGIHCRFGARGIIAEAHYDGGRNYVSMARGHKRYILAPPSQCTSLHILQRGPSARHSAVDWSNPGVPNPRWAEYYPLNVADDTFYAAKTVDTVIGAGDALYIPSFWFHYPISLDTNIQCNSRSGTPDMGVRHINKCGFAVRTSEGVAAEAQKIREEDKGVLASIARKTGLDVRPIIWGKPGGGQGQSGGGGVSALGLSGADPIWIAVWIMAGCILVVVVARVAIMCWNRRMRRSYHRGL